MLSDSFHFEMTFHSLRGGSFSGSLAGVWLSAVENTQAGSLFQCLNPPRPQKKPPKIGTDVFMQDI